ncbi:unnamed protein product [Pleuronectes platessa]|uniref:Uncharacterized protein n=1 Tax=Pleuronectes platessa TaxID=8262 RepID=A0A9N7UP45_PLEPL|nr:unnamed protein product [Pleuronectes platessa]
MYKRKMSTAGSIQENRTVQMRERLLNAEEEEEEEEEELPCFHSNFQALQVTGCCCCCCCCCCCGGGGGGGGGPPSLHPRHAQHPPQSFLSVSLATDESRGGNRGEGTSDDVAVETQQLLGGGCRHQLIRNENRANQSQAGSFTLKACRTHFNVVIIIRTSIH